MSNLKEFKMNLFKKLIKKNTSLIISSLAVSGLLINLFQKEIKAFPVTVEKCETGQIPTAAKGCLIDPISYKLDLYRVYICREDPFPASATKANLDVCMALFIDNNNPYTAEFANNSFTLPKTGMDEIVNGSYSHVAVVFENIFRGKGSYTVGGTTYKTLKSFTEEGTNVSTTLDAPQTTIDELKSWRGSDGNSDNPYCKDGATVSRCETDFNGYKVTGIITDSSFNAVWGDTSARLFYLAKLTNPFTLNKNSSGSIEITVENNYEVGGNNEGTEVRNMNISPFVFQPTYLSN